MSVQVLVDPSVEVSEQQPVGRRHAAVIRHQEEAERAASAAKAPPAATRRVERAAPVDRIFNAD